MCRTTNDHLRAQQGPAAFHGWRVVAATFVLAMFGWGLGFYGPPIFMQVVAERQGWPVALVATAITVHFLVGALVVAFLPRMYRHWGIPATTKAGAATLALGVVGWALAGSLWQLFLAALVSGAGWVMMGAAAVNAILSPWFISKRPKALAMAYNGASVGGVVFSPLLVALIGTIGFLMTAVGIGLVMVVTIWLLADRMFARTPADLRQYPDGQPDPILATRPDTSPAASPGAPCWRSRPFLTLALAMALCLFAQVGLLAHLFSLLVPALGAQQAAFAMGLATASAITGRTLLGWAMRPQADRRLIAAASLGMQMLGGVTLIGAGGTHAGLLLLGVILFGAGIGNATSLPPLIAQAEFAQADLARVVALIVAVSQATYAFAPMALGALRPFGAGWAADDPAGALPVFVAVLAVQAMATAAYLAGRSRRPAAAMVSSPCTPG